MASDAEDPKVGGQARELVADAEAILDELEAAGTLKAHAVFGLFPANSFDEDIAVYTDEERTEECGRFHMLRQMKRPSGKANQCLADWVAPRGLRIGWGHSW